MPPAVAILGLGEAGGAIGSGLVAAGCKVRAWDPLVTAPPTGIERADGPTEAVTATDLVLSLTTSAHAVAAAVGVAPALTPAQLYADLNTAAPSLKREVASLIGQSGAAFADVALLGTVPALGVATPAVASGDGAERFAELVRPLGMPVDIVGDEPGEAAGLKLLRSVFMKGVAAAVFESVEAAKARGAEEWLRGQIADVLGGPLLERLLSGSVTHAERRLDEMEAAAAYVKELGVEPLVSRAAADWLRELSAPHPPSASPPRTTS